MRILVTDGMNAAAIEELRQRGHEVTEKFYAPEELGQALYEHDCVIVRSKTKVREPHLRRGAEGRLKLVIRGGVGVDNIDVAVAESLGVSVRNTPNASSASVAELVIFIQPTKRIPHLYYQFWANVQTVMTGEKLFYRQDSDLL